MIHIEGDTEREYGTVCMSTILALKPIYINMNVSIVEQELRRVATKVFFDMRIWGIHLAKGNRSYCAFQMTNEMSFKYSSTASNQIVAMLPRCISAGRQECYSKNGMHTLATVCDYSRLIGYWPNRFPFGKHSTCLEMSKKKKKTWDVVSNQISLCFPQPIWDIQNLKNLFKWENK